MLAYFFDQHVKREIAKGLRSRGIDVLTAFEDGAADWDDDRLLERATHLGRVLVTWDDDFLVLASAWQSRGRDFAGIVFGEQRKVSIGQWVGDLELTAHVLNPQEIRNRVEFLPL